MRCIFCLELLQVHQAFHGELSSYFKTGEGHKCKLFRGSSGRMKEMPIGYVNPVWAVGSDREFLKELIKSYPWYILKEGLLIELRS